MKWQQKALAFKFMEHIPLGHRMHYLIQRHVTKTLPRSRKKIASYSTNVVRHKDNILKHHGDLADEILFEFGAGWDLCSNIAMYCFGVDRQIVLDLQRLARPHLINHVIACYRGQPIEGMLREPGPPVGADLEGDLRRNFGIDYGAPRDAAATGLPDGSLDLVISTNTLEHIPREAIARILRECHRICHPASTLSMKIDYADHYAYADPSINIYNFLKYDEDEWSRYNPPQAASCSA
jgi:hypothetical protein